MSHYPLLLPPSLSLPIIYPPSLDTSYHLHLIEQDEQITLKRNMLVYYVIYCMSNKYNILYFCDVFDKRSRTKKKKMVGSYVKLSHHVI